MPKKFKCHVKLKISQKNVKKRHHSNEIINVMINEMDVN